jgi:integrase
VNKYLSLLSSVLKWAVKHDYLSKNPSEGLQLDLNRRADEERKAYDLEDIKRICQRLPPKDGVDPFKFWIPMIAMYTGMRREEICQLHGEDIKQVDGVWCFDVNDNGQKSLKTQSSARVIPIHSALLKIGLLDYTRTIAINCNLWGFRQWKGVWGKRFGNWWSLKFNRQFVTSDPQKVFHSFRHGVANCLKQSGASEPVATALLGHNQNGITFNRYAKRYNPSRLAEAVEMISYG